MKSYLSLIPISAHVRRRQSRMTITCIVLAVFLVTAIFSLADAGEKGLISSNVDKAGYWHIKLNQISESDGAEIASRPDVAATSWYDVINLDENLVMDKDYDIQGAQTALCGIEEPFLTDIMHYFSDGAHISSENEVILTENARELLGVKEGDVVTLNTPAGSYDFVITGFRITGDGKYVNANGGITSALLVKDNQVGAFMDIHAFDKICQENGETSSPQYYIQFGRRANVKKSMEEIKEQYGLADSDIELNTILMASKGVSGKSYINSMYFIAGIFVVLVLTAGVIMISSSMNSNIAQRMQFFGMMRCIGASKRQIMHFVRLEALNWCKTAVPAGILSGMAATWILSAVIKYLAEEFEGMPIFTVSILGILCGAAVGIITVLLAAQAPAKRASKASPMVAVSGNVQNADGIKRAANVHISKIETALGIHHAMSAKKNLLLMTASFALSIILFLCFSVLIELVGYLMPQKASAPDIDITSTDLTNSIDVGLVKQIEEIDGVSHAFGRRVCFDMPALLGDGTAETIDFMSYDDYGLDLLKKDKDLRKGSNLAKVYGDSHSVLVIWDKDMPLKMGDKIQIGGEELEIAGMLKYSPFSNNGSTNGKITIIASNETFVRLTGITGYAIIDVQLGGGTSQNEGDEAAAQIRKLSEGYDFRDRQDEDTGGTFFLMVILVYGFVVMIALITLLNIMNSISMSVSAKINQYGAMRAIGMSVQQLAKMVAAEALTYAGFGCIMGCGIGLFLSKYMYDSLVTSHFYYFTWSLPIMQIVIVILFVLASVLAAVYAPAKRIRDMSIVDTIQAQ